MMWKRQSTRRGNLPAAIATEPAGPEELLAIAEQAHALEDFEGAATAYEELLSLGGPSLEPATRVRVLCQLAEVHSLLGHPDDAEPVASEAVTSARDLDASMLVWALYTAGYVAWRRDDFDAARTVLVEAIGLARALEEPQNHVQLGPALLNLARVSFSEGQWDQGRELINELMTLNTTSDALLCGCSHAQWMARESGDFYKALHFAERAWTMTIQSGVVQPIRLIGTLARRSHAALDLGDLDSARTAVSQALQLAQRTKHGAKAHAAAADLALEGEDWKGAEFHIERALAATVGEASRWNMQLFLVQAVLLAGEHHRADDLFQALKVARTESTDHLAAALLFLDGGIQHARGDLDRARASYRQAGDSYRRMGWHASAARVALDLGLVEADAGRPDTARRYLNEATPLAARPSNLRRRAKLAGRVT